MHRLPLLSLLTLLSAACTLGEPLEVGQLEQAIVNGSVDEAHEAVGVLHSGGSSACTATLVGPRTVLTAAHCVVKAGSLLSPVNFYPQGFSGVKRTAASVVVHPKYTGGNQSDLAVVMLAEALEGIAPARLASTPPKQGEAIELVGFGKTGEESGGFGTRRRALNQVAQVETELFRVFGSAGSAGNVCDGDSGGPSFARRGGIEYMIGVHSTKGGACGQEGNDMRVDAFLPFVTEAAGGDLGGQDQAAPSVQFLSPRSNAEIASSLTIELSASDDTGVSRLVLYANGEKRGEQTGAPYRFTLQSLPLGSLTLRAVAHDSAGRTASTSIEVRVRTLGGPATGPLAPAGSTCQTAAECHSNSCITGICAQSCAGPADCPDGQCQEGLCQLSPIGSFGAACQDDSGCLSGLCGLDAASGQAFCTQTCSLAQPSCPGGSSCRSEGQGGLCSLPATQPAAGDGLESGCSVAGPGSGLGSLPIMLLLGLGLLRRRGLRPRR